MPAMVNTAEVGRVTLDKAAQLACVQLNAGHSLWLDDDAAQEEEVALAAMALSMVAPVYRPDPPGDSLVALTPHEINERLFRSVQLGKRQLRDRLVMRRDDLEHAIALLRAANRSFRPDGLRL